MDFAINVQDEGVTGNGVTDDAPALNALFNAIALAGAATVYFPKGTYLLKGNVYLDGSSQVTPITGLRVFADPGTIIKAATPAQGGVWTGSASALFMFRASATPSTNIVIEGFTFDSQSFGTTGEVAMGIYTTAITGLTIRNCTFQNIGDTALGTSSSPRNDGIMLGDDAPNFTVSMRAKDVLIEKCRFINIVRNGISGLDVDGLVVDRCYFDNIDNSGIDIEPNHAQPTDDFDQFARDIKITNCTFTNWAVAAVVVVPGEAHRGGLYAAQMEGVKVTNCYMDGAAVGKTGVYAWDWIDVDISNNTIIRVTDPPILLRSCQNVRVIGNHIRDCNNLTGAILVNQATDVLGTVQPKDHIIQGNTINNITGYGIRLGDLDTGSVVGNIVHLYDTTLGGRTGISCLASTSTCRNVAIVANIVTGGGGEGGVSPGGQPIDISSACTRMLCVGNICQQNGGGAYTDAIDNDMASGVHAYNADEQRATFPFISPSGSTPLSGGAMGGTAARKVSMEVAVAAGAGAGQVDTASDFITLAPVVNMVFSPISAAAAEMMLIAGGVYCARTSTGFKLVHQGNPSGSIAYFQVLASTS